MNGVLRSRGRTTWFQPRSRRSSKATTQRNTAWRTTSHLAATLAAVGNWPKGRLAVVGVDSAQPHSMQAMAVPLESSFAG